MRERERFLAAEQKRELIDQAGGMCAVCRVAPAIYLAHRIPKTKANLRLYGPIIVHHRLNLVPVCSDPACNDACLIDNRPREKARLLAQIEVQIQAQIAVDFGLSPCLRLEEAIDDD